nr:hypothetical protein [Tanacetum cinerariifolium]
KARIAQSSALPTVADEPASLVRDAQEEVIVILKERIQVLEDREGVTERINNESEEIARVLTSMDAATVLAGGIDVPTDSGSIPTAGPPATVISTSSKVEDFIRMGSKEETERLKRKGLNLEQEQVKKQKLSEEALEIETSTKEFTEEKMKEMMQLVHVKDVYVQALQVKHPIIDWKVHTEGQRSYWQIIRLRGSSACY